MKGEVEKYMTVAKAAVYNEARARVFLPMLNTRQGAVNAVLQMVAAIDAKRPLDAQVKPMLAMHIYLMMVDVAMNATGQKPDKEVMRGTMQALLASIGEPKGAQ